MSATPAKPLPPRPRSSPIEPPLRPFSAIARELNLHTATLSRWRDQGLKTRTGERVKLLATRIGGRWMSSATELDRFFGALGDGNSMATVTARTVAARNHAARAAERALDRLGI